MKKANAETFAQNIDDSFSDDTVTARVEVHGEDEAEIVLDIDYREEDPQRLIIERGRQALAIFQLIYASKEQGLEDSLGSI